jgi:uncharacterized OB-fold protein
MTATEHDIVTRPAPVPYRSSEHYWSAAGSGRLALQRCPSGHVQFYARAHCRRCGSTDLEWFDAAGHGTVHTFSVVHRAAHEGFTDKLPYVFAVVELVEGVRVTANIVGCDPHDVTVDLPVEVSFEDSIGDVALPQFTPTRTHEEH